MAIIALLTLVFNRLKNIAPLGKVIIIADRDNWIAIGYDAIIKKYRFARHVVVRLPFFPPIKPDIVTVDADFRNAEHKGINLYRVAKYNICVSLEVFPSQISFENEVHRTVIRKWYAESIRCIDFFEKIFLQWRPDIMLISQGHTYDAVIVRALSCIHHFNIVAVENTFNKNKIIWDDISGITVNKNLARNYYWKYRDFLSDAAADLYVREYLANIKQLKTQEHQTPSEIVLKSDKKTVLFIGQVYTDSSVLFGINDFSCPVAIIEKLVDYCLLNNYHLIIKLHPKEEMGNNIYNLPYNSLTYRKISEQEGLLGKISSGGFVLDKDRFDTYSLIDSADVCVTVNSQAGLEALIKGKEVIVCGQGYYTGLGFTFEALNNECLICFLDLVLRRGVSAYKKADIEKFFYIVSEKYFIQRTEDSLEKLLMKGHL